MSWLNFDQELADKASASFKPIPVDTVLSVRIAGADLRDTKKGGQMVTLELAVISGQHKGRKIWRNFNIECSSESLSHAERKALVGVGQIVGVDLSQGPHKLRALKGRDLLCTVVKHEEDTYTGTVKIREIVGNFAADPDARALVDFDDDDDIPF